MNTIAKQALDIVEDLNNDIEERGDLEYYAPFEFKSNGWQSSAISFMGVFIWTEENDERDYVDETDEKESLRNFIIRQSKMILKDLNVKMRFLKSQKTSEKKLNLCTVSPERTMELCEAVLNYLGSRINQDTQPKPSLNSVACLAADVMKELRNV